MSDDQDERPEASREAAGAADARIAEQEYVAASNAMFRVRRRELWVQDQLTESEIENFLFAKRQDRKDVNEILSDIIFGYAKKLEEMGFANVLELGIIRKEGDEITWRPLEFFDEVVALGLMGMWPVQYGFAYLAEGPPLTRQWWLGKIIQTASEAFYADKQDQRERLLMRLGMEMARYGTLPHLRAVEERATQIANVRDGGKGERQARNLERREGRNHRKEIAKQFAQEVQKKNPRLISISAIAERVKRI